MRRALILVGLALVAILLLAGGAGWIWRIPLLAAAATRLVDSKGFGPATLVITTATLDVVRLRDISLRGGAVRAREVVLSYDPLDLPQGHLRHVTIDGLEVAAVIGADGLDLGGAPFTAGGGGTTLPVTIDVLEIAGARLAVDAPAGSAEATLTARLAVADGAIRASAIVADIVAPLAGTRRSLHLEVPELAVERAESSVRLHVAGARIVPRDLPWTAEGITGDVNWQRERMTAELAEARLINHQRPRLVAPLGVSATADLDGPQIGFTVAVHAGPGAAGRLEGKGHHDRSSGSGFVSLTFQPISFHQGSLQPGDLMPVLSGIAQDVAGSVSFAGTLRWTSEAMTPDVVMQLKHLAFTTSMARLSEIDGAIRLNKLFPPATPPNQMLSATINAAGLPPAKLSLVCQLTGKPALKIERAALAVTGGDIAATAFIIDPAAPHVETVAQVEHVDLAEITALLAIEGLSGTGRLDGRIPIDVEGSTVTVAGGRLAAEEPGVLRYKPERLPPQIAAAGEQVALALKALEDFRYESLALDFDKGAGGEGKVVLRVKGRNPAVDPNQEFIFNIAIASNFDRLAELAVLSISSAQLVLRNAAGGVRP